MDKNALLGVLRNRLDQDSLPNAPTQHNPNPAYIRALITRARIVNGSLSREGLAKKCGISISSLNKYTKPVNNISCPFVTQKTLETISGIKSSENNEIFRIKFNVSDSEVNFFSMFDNFRSSKWEAFATAVSIEVVLTPEEANVIKKDAMEFEKISI